MIRPTRTRVFQQTAALLACLGALVTLSGCFGSGSCDVAIFMRKDTAVDRALEKLKTLNTLEDAKAVCWEDRQAANLTTEIPPDVLSDFGLVVMAGEASHYSADFSEIKSFVEGKKSQLSTHVEVSERFIRLPDGTPLNEIRKQALLRMPIYKLHPQIKSTAMAATAFCAQAAKLKDQKDGLGAKNVAGMKFLMLLRQKAADELARLKIAFNEPALAKATQDACAGSDLGESNPEGSAVTQHNPHHGKPALIDGRPAEDLVESSGSGKAMPTSR